MRAGWRNNPVSGVWQLKTFSLPKGISVYKGHEDEGGWRVTADDIGLMHMGLASKDLEDALEEAVRMVRLYAQRVVQELE